MQDRKSEQTGPHRPASCGKRNFRFSATFPQETTPSQAPQGFCPPSLFLLQAQAPAKPHLCLCEHVRWQQLGGHLYCLFSLN